MGETISADNCCTAANGDKQKESAKRQILLEQTEYENKMEIESAGNTSDEYLKESKVDTAPMTVALTPKELPPWDMNSTYHNTLTYMEVSQRYLHYRKPPNFYDDCIRKLRSAARQTQHSTQKQAQFESIIQNTSKSLLRTRTMLTASVEEQQQSSIINLIHEISENDEKFWFQPFLFNVIDSVTHSFIKLVDSKRELVLTHADFYRILTILPVLSDVLAKDYPFHFHSQTQDRLEYLFDPNDITYIKRKQDIINLLEKANKLNRTVCAVGYATTIASNNNNCIDNDDKKSDSPLVAAMIPNHLRVYTYDISIEYADDLSGARIKEYDLMYVRDIGNNKICIGGATPIWLYREWCHKRIECKKKILSEPCSVQSLYHSFVGAISISEHGGGYMTSALSDYCTKIVVLNSDGKEIEYSNESDDDFKSLLPNLGLLGIVIEIELQFVEEYYCKLNVGVINIDKLFPKSKTKTKSKNKGRTFSKAFEDIINSTRYNEFFWFPTTNQIYSVSLDHCIDDNAPSQLFPSKTWETNWLILQREINALTEILSIQLLNGNEDSFWTNKLATKLITKINVNLLNDLVIKLNLRPKMRAVSSPKTNNGQQTMKLVSCDALHLFEFYPSQSNNNLFQNIEWLFPLNSKSHRKILINGHHVPNVELAAHLFMSAINCYNQNMLKDNIYPYQHALNLKVIKASQSNGISHCTSKHEADFYCTVNMNVFNIEQNKIFQQFHKEFVQTCKYKVYGGNIEGIKPHWRNLQSFKFMKIVQNGNSQNYSDIYSFIKYQYKEKFDKLNEIRYRDNKNPQIFEHEYLRNILH